MEIRRGDPRLVLTGDTLFIGDVGRPDLVGSKGFTPEQMASMLYDSVHGKLLKLRDEVLVYPAHGAGSLCGRSMSKETFSTMGEQRRTNHALQPMSREAFVRMATSDLPEVPDYFARDVAMNREGARRRIRRATAGPPGPGGGGRTSERGSDDPRRADRPPPSPPRTSRGP